MVRGHEIPQALWPSKRRRSRSRPSCCRHPNTSTDGLGLAIVNPTLLYKFPVGPSRPRGSSILIDLHAVSAVLFSFHSRKAEPRPPGCSETTSARQHQQAYCCFSVLLCHFWVRVSLKTTYLSLRPVEQHKSPRNLQEMSESALISQTIVASAQRNNSCHFS